MRLMERRTVVVGRLPAQALGQLGLRRAAAAGIGYFGVVFAVGFVLGTARVMVVAPRLGETGAVAAELRMGAWRGGWGWRRRWRSGCFRWRGAGVEGGGGLFGSG